MVGRGKGRGGGGDRGARTCTVRDTQTGSTVGVFPKLCPDGHWPYEEEQGQHDKQHTRQRRPDRKTERDYAHERAWITVTGGAALSKGHCIAHKVESQATSTLVRAHALDRGQRSRMWSWSHTQAHASSHMVTPRRSQSHQGHTHKYHTSRSHTQNNKITQHHTCAIVSAANGCLHAASSYMMMPKLSRTWRERQVRQQKQKSDGSHTGLYYVHARWLSVETAGPGPLSIRHPHHPTQLPQPSLPDHASNLCT